MFLNNNKGIGPAGGNALIRALDDNLSIVMLEVDGCSLSRSQLRAIRSSVHENQTFFFKYLRRSMSDLPSLVVRAARKGCFDVCESILAESQYYSSIEKKSSQQHGGSISNSIMTRHVLTDTLKATYSGIHWDSARKDRTRQLLLPGADLDQLLPIQKNHAMGLYVKKWMSDKDPRSNGRDLFDTHSSNAIAATPRSMNLQSSSLDASRQSYDRRQMLSMPGKFWVEIEDDHIVSMDWISLIYMIGVLRYTNIGVANSSEEKLFPHSGSCGLRLLRSDSCAQ